MKELTMTLCIRVGATATSRRSTIGMHYLPTLLCCLFVEELAGSFLSAELDEKVKCVRLRSEELAGAFGESVAMALDPKHPFKLVLGSVGAKAEARDWVTVAWSARGSSGSESPGSESQQSANPSSDDEGEGDEDEDGKSAADSSDGDGSDPDEDDGHHCGGDDEDEDPPSSGGESDDDGPDEPDDASASDSDGSS